MKTLVPREAYRRWAAQYETENAVTHLENQLVAALHIPLADHRLLDVGCGNGERLRAAHTAWAVGVDLVPEMFASTAHYVAADLRALPFAHATFDVVWCRLVMGYIPELGEAYRALRRVCRTEGTIVVTDFHPNAVAAGHRRTFRDVTGEVYAIESVAHQLEAHLQAAEEVGLKVTTSTDGVVGPEVRHFYERANRLHAYEQQYGLQLVFALAFSVSSA